MKFIKKLTEKLRKINEDGRAGVLFGLAGWFIIAIIVLLLMWLSAGCCPCRHLQTDTRDSVRVETRTEYVERWDTARVEIPVEIYRNVTPDTSSTIRGTYASTTARVVAGMLHHDLTCGGLAPVQVKTVEVVRDSLVWRDRVQTSVVEVARPLTRWQRFQKAGFWVLLAAGVAVVGWRVARRFL